MMMMMKYHVHLILGSASNAEYTLERMRNSSRPKNHFIYNIPG